MNYGPMRQVLFLNGGKLPSDSGVTFLKLESNQGH